MKGLAHRSRLGVLADLRTVEMFVTLADTRSFTRTAQLLGVSASTLSKKLADLEQRAGVRFLERTSRTVDVTEAGMRFRDLGRKLIGEAAALEQGLLDHGDEIGRVRVRAPTVLAERRLAPLISSFMRDNPSVEINLLSLNESTAHPETGIDLTISIRADSEVTDTMEVIAPQPRVFCAAPAYLDVAGVPQTLDDLKRHRCLVFQFKGRTPSFDACVGTRVTAVQVSGPLVSDNANIIVGAVRDGFGVAQLGTHVIEDDIASGRLIPILAEYNPRPRKVVAIVADSEFVSSSTLAFLDHLKTNWTS